MTQPTDQPSTGHVRALDHIDPQGSIVRSGLLLADAVIAALNAQSQVEVSFEGVRGTPSSYFNVFLRRVEEVCGIAEIDNHIRLHFGSQVQKMIFDRSLESLRHKGPYNPPVKPPSGDAQPVPQDPPSFWARFVRVFSRGADRR